VPFRGNKIVKCHPAIGREDGVFDTSCALCYTKHVKTISLTESAYQRLLSWKTGGTFSEVVERMIPCKGTLSAAVEAAQMLPALSDADFEDLERMVHSTRHRLTGTWS
jgi:predicted CopG family antitoxin